MSKLFLKRKLCNIHTFQLYYYYYSLNSTVCRFVIKEIAGIAEKRLKYDNFFMIHRRSLLLIIFHTSMQSNIISIIVFN